MLSSVLFDRSLQKNSQFSMVSCCSFSLLLLLSSFLLLLSPSNSSSTTILRVNSTIPSPNKTFELCFFNLNTQLNNWYLGIRYASLPTTNTYVWVANREIPIKDPSSASLSLSSDGKLTLSDSVNFVVWSSQNDPVSTNSSSSSSLSVSLLDSANLLLLSPSGDVLWQSFDYPSDTWLPGMNLTSHRWLTSWKSLWDPSPGRYSLRIKPPDFGEIELVYNDTVSYWSTGNWTGSSFANVPEMQVRYIYHFYFENPSTKAASFGFSEQALPDIDLLQPLTRFHVDFAGKLRQYTWSAQTENWNMFWARPEAQCGVLDLCGPNGLCYESVGSLPLKACGCPNGYGSVDEFGWAGGDFSRGCKRVGKDGCDGNGERDGFEEVGVMSFDGATTTSFQGVANRGECENTCLGNCSCVGVVYNERNSLCKNVFGELVNLQNLSSDSTMSNEVLYLRVGSTGKTPPKHKIVVLIAVICGLVVVLAIMGSSLLILRWLVRKRRNEEEEAALAATNLRVFSYKELHAATRGFSEKLGHGGFGTVFRGTLSDSSLVAVKRLERPGNGGEKEFRAEVCTIGNVQHVNLVRLRGFCSENSHRLLVYDYMPNGPLSGYLKKDGLNMGWDVRFRVAIGTAKALAYLHEECRDCIIHCDIKPENILLDRDYDAKVSDFGLAKLIGRDFSRVLATMRGTWGYVAPEWISGVAITTKADVYSYGMTMLELIGGRRNVVAPPPSPPNGDHGNNSNVSSGGDGGSGDKWFFPPWAARQIIDGNMAEVVDPRLGVAYDRVEAERLGMVAVWCIQDEEMARPSMGMVVKMLEGVIEVGIPPPPKLLQALVSGESFPGVGTGVDSDNGVVTGNTDAAGVCSDDNNRVSVDSVLSHSPGNDNASPLPTRSNMQV